MKTKLLAILMLLSILLCSCGDGEDSLSDTAWKNGEDVTVYFYADGTGRVSVDGVHVDFTYAFSEGTLDVTCNDFFLAESYGLGDIPLFGTNAVERDGEYMYIGSWELEKVK